MSRARAVEFISAHFGVLSILVVFVGLFAFFSVQADAFLTTENLLNVGRQIAPTVVVGTLMTFVITTGAIDLSVGSMVGLSAAALALMARTGNPFLALAVTLAIGAAIGLVNGYLSAYGRLQSFIVTLAALTAVRGVALLITQGYSTPISVGWILAIGQGRFPRASTPRRGSRSLSRRPAGTCSHRRVTADTSLPWAQMRRRCAAPVWTSGGSSCWRSSRRASSRRSQV